MDGYTSKPHNATHHVCPPTFPSPNEQPPTHNSMLVTQFFGKKKQVEVMDVEDAKQRAYVVDRAEVALLPREQRKEVLTKHYPKCSRVFAQVCV